MLVAAGRWSSFEGAFLANAFWVQLRRRRIHPHHCRSVLVCSVPPFNCLWESHTRRKEGGGIMVGQRRRTKPRNDDKNLKENGGEDGEASLYDVHNISRYLTPSLCLQNLPGQ